MTSNIYGRHQVDCRYIYYINPERSTTGTGTTQKRRVARDTQKIQQNPTDKGRPKNSEM